MTLPTTMCEAFQRTAAGAPDKVALRTPGGAVSITWREYADRVKSIAAGLAGLGVTHGDTVALMLTNRPEFHVVDTAVLHAGATPFSIYNTLAVEQVIHVLSDSGARVVVCEPQFVPKLLEAKESTAVEHIVCVEQPPEGTVALDTLPAKEDFDFEASWRAVKPDDVLTVIYTSGTTGPPKGVELTHASMMAEVDATTELGEVGYDDRIVSYLPDAHVANRWGAHYNSLVFGIQITTVDEPKKVLGALGEVRPTFFGAVPQIWYKVKAAIETTLAAEQSPVKKRLGTWALDVAQRNVKAGASASALLKLQAGLADRLVLSKVREKLGLEQVRVAASGAAPIAPEALEFVLALGIPVCEVWGMSETSAVVTMNRPGEQRIGTVGTTVKGMEVKLADDGELLVRGPLLMKGYRNQPEKTAETIDADGWLHTGDIATIDDDGFVSIVDRKKELIINASGKNMSPANIENNLKVACPLIGSAVAIGDNRPYVVALITLDPDAMAAFAAAEGLDASNPAALSENPKLLAAVEAGVKAANDNLARVEQIKKYTVLPVVWEPGGDEVTPTMKLKRKPIAEKYQSDIDALYA